MPSQIDYTCKTTQTAIIIKAKTTKCKQFNQITIYRNEHPFLIIQIFTEILCQTGGTTLE